jgi:Outer mitochondrial membrane transport complex protein
VILLLGHAPSPFVVGKTDPFSVPNTGEVPALECDGVLVQTPKDAGSFGAARAIFSHLKARGADIDAGLPDELKAELLAFTALCQTQLEPASLFTTWCEPESFQNYTQVGTSVLPLDPLCCHQLAAPRLNVCGLRMVVMKRKGEGGVGDGIGHASALVPSKGFWLLAMHLW